MYSGKVSADSPPETDPFAFLRRSELEVVRGSDPPTLARRFADLGPEVLVDGRWRLKTSLGRGGFGVVYEAASETGDSAPMALKLIAPESDPDTWWTRRFEQEADVAMGLHHPNIVRTFERGQLEDGTRYLVMELLEGESLRDRLSARVGLPWDQVAAIAEQLGGALGRVHARGIVHRDIKPSNLFIVGTAETMERAVLIDFGLCKGPSAITASREQLGTRPYLAPEMLVQDARHATSAVDVYGLAVLSYETVTGRRAFAEVPTGDAPPPLASLRADVPEGLTELIGLGMSPRPHERPRDVAAYGNAIARTIRLAGP